ncbi:hypothetical protein F5883DRAFT_656072 [Diaporthe sp. PMI_573]|nr:hypothetical protein F5883DRAFT_656072 [Diaporthaceae sp. PMI_573]
MRLTASVEVDIAESNSFNSSTLSLLTSGSVLSSPGNRGMLATSLNPMLWGFDRSEGGEGGDHHSGLDFPVVTREHFTTCICDPRLTVGTVNSTLAPELGALLRLGADYKEHKFVLSGETPPTPPATTPVCPSPASTFNFTPFIANGPATLDCEQQNVPQVDTLEKDQFGESLFYPGARSS